MRDLFLATGLWTCAFASLFAMPAQAATFEVLQERPLYFDEISKGACSLRLTGVIEAGDAAKIEAAIEQGMEDEPKGQAMVNMLMTELAINFPQGMQRGHSLCLSSRGGSFTGGVALAKVLIENGISTVIEPGRECLSACAVAFMGGAMGSSNSSGGGRMPYRVMDVTARLGFHAPFIPFDKLGKSIPPAMAEESFRTALRTMVLITEALQNKDLVAPTGRFPTVLLLEMLNTYGADQFSYVDTVNEVGLYDIRLTGVPEIEIDAAGWATLCSNVTNWARGQKIGPYEPDLPSHGYWVTSAAEGADEYIPLPEDLPLRALAEGEPEFDPQAFLAQVEARRDNCTIYPNSGPGDAYSVAFIKEDQDETLDFRSVDAWASLPRYVRFEDFAGRAQVPAGLFQSVDTERDRAMRQKTPSVLPAFEPGQVWSLGWQGAEEDVPPFSLIDLGAEGRAKLVLDHWEYEVPEQDWPYTIAEGRLCITTDKPFCLSRPDGVEPFTIRYEREGQASDVNVYYVRPHVAP